MRGRIRFVIMFLCMLFICPIKAQAEEKFSVSASCQRGQTVKLCISVEQYDDLRDGYDIYRMNATTGMYELVGTIDLYEDGTYAYMNDNGWEEYYETGVLRLYYDIKEVHNIGETYTYQVKSFEYNSAYDGDDTEHKENYKIYFDTAETTVTILGDSPKITYGKRSGKLGAKLKWTTDKTADGYYIYAVKNYTNKSRKKYVDVYDDSAYSMVKEITKGTTGSATVKKLMHGATYNFRVCSYRIVNGEKLTSMLSEPKSVLMNYYSYNGETTKQKTKRAFGSESKKKKNFATSSKAAKQMKKIKIKVWDFKNGKKGKKVTRTKYLTVNKKLAPSIKAMFDEIYKSKEKQVIKDIGCYSYRTGEHMYGLAIDINPNENYMIDGKKILSGSFWKPKKNKYSIPLDCETVRIMERYGFRRGFWGDRKDYMHFSYFGT